MTDSIMPVLIAIYTNQEVRWLVALVIANLVLGIVASLRRGDFALTEVANWLLSRLVPMFVGYGVASFLAVVNPEVESLRLLATATLAGTMLAYVIRNLRDIGYPVEEKPAGTAK